MFWLPLSPHAFRRGQNRYHYRTGYGLKPYRQKDYRLHPSAILGAGIWNKGGASGGGYSQVIPKEDFNLHFNGDAHAVSLANNLLAAFIDNSFLKRTLNIKPETITWRRVLDVSERFLRNIKIGLGGKDDGIERDTGFDITAASEITAILALSRDPADLRKG